MAKGQKQPEELLRRLTDIYLALMLSVFLLWPGRGGYGAITEAKAALFFLLSGLYVSGMVLLRLELSLVGALPRPNIRASMGLPQWLVAGYWAFSLLSALLSDFRGTALWGSQRREGLVTITLYCALFLLVSRYARPRPWMLWLFSAAVTANGLLACLQLMGLNPFALYPKGMTYFDGNKLYSGQFLGTVGNVDLLSALLCVAIPVCWVAMMRLKDKRRFLLAVPLAVSLFVLLKAFVSGGVVGIFLGAVLTAPVLLEGRGRHLALAAAGIILVLGLGAVYLAGDRMGGFLYEANELLHGNFDDSFGSGRIYIWRKSLELVEGNLLLGGGPDTMGLRTDAVFQRFDEDLGVLIRSHVDTAHNEYLNILVNQGLFALLCFLGALVTAGAQWLRCAAKSPLAAICGAGVLGYCIQAFFGISSLITAPYFWLALALLAHAAGCEKSSIRTGGSVR